VRIGNFAELNRSKLGENSRSAHFSYIGDADVGVNVNVGAGTVTCNYDGESKHETVIEDGAFIGSDSMLVAPVRVGARSRTGAGSVITRDVPPDSQAYGVPAKVRSREAADDES
jgi:bifunctional UDP-N-acetylglucosamine pyrophosphorylase/glucosamine-1-phosphate N-acetyltransferase